jgi:hypothetical protein
MKKSIILLHKNKVFRKKKKLFYIIISYDLFLLKKKFKEILDFDKS